MGQRLTRAYRFSEGRLTMTTVFNIGGNKYRLVVNVVYTMRTVFVEGVYTHVEYDRLTRAGLLGY